MVFASFLFSLVFLFFFLFLSSSFLFFVFNCHPFDKFFIFVVLAGWLISQVLDWGVMGLFLAFIFASGSTLVSYYQGDKIALALAGAKLAKIRTEPRLYSAVENLARAAQIPTPKIYVAPDPAMNAFATGRNPKNSSICVTRGLLNNLNQTELEGVIGHELAHIKHRDILISTIAATIAGAISYLAYMAQWAMIFGGRSDDDEGGHPIAAFLMMILAPIIAMIIQLAISRAREYAADEGGAKIAGNPLYLANALRKLHYASQAIPMDANPGTAHMFIVNPISGRSLMKLFSTHPPIEERIARLEAMMGRY